MSEARTQILAACDAGDMPALEALFARYNIGPSHPRAPYGGTPTDQFPSIAEMIDHAVIHAHIPLIDFLGARYPGTSCSRGPLSRALELGDPAVITAVGRIDKQALSGELHDDSSVNALGWAACQPNGAALVKALLDAGANPNTEPPRGPLGGNVTSAVVHGLPLETFVQYRDAGYCGNDAFAMPAAVDHGRADVLELLYAVAIKHRVPEAYVPDKEELLAKAREKKDFEMVVTIERVYATRLKTWRERLRDLVKKA